MTGNTRRITLITSGTASPDRGWDTSPLAASRLIFAKTLAVLRYALGQGIAEMAQDIERVILDGSSTAADFLDLLASLPQEFTGDVVLIRGDESGFLSASGRGGDRVLYSFDRHDVQFYLSAHGLLASVEHEQRKSA